MTVFGKRLFRETEQRRATGTLHGLRRHFVVAEQHAGWGADLASQVGATSRTVELVRHHHDLHLPDPDSQSQRLLAALQSADEQN
jgi:hypothetical protein